MDNEAVECEKKVPIAIQTEPNIWKMWWVSPVLAEQLSKLIKSDDFVTAELN